MRVQAEVRFAIIPEWVLFADISAQAVRLYGAIARHANLDGEAKLYRKTLAAELRCSVVTIHRALRELVGIGAVQIHHHYSQARPGQRLASSYVLRVTPSASSVEGGGFTDASRGGGTDETVVNESPFERESVPSEPPGEPASKRPRDEAFDELASLDGGPEGMTKRELRRIGVMLAEIRGATPGVDAAEIRRRAANFRALGWARGAAPSAGQLVSAWAKCAGDLAPEAVRARIDRYREQLAT